MSGIGIHLVRSLQDGYACLNSDCAGHIFADDEQSITGQTIVVCDLCQRGFCALCGQRALKMGPLFICPRCALGSGQAELYVDVGMIEAEMVTLDASQLCAQGRDLSEMELWQLAKNKLADEYRQRAGNHGSGDQVAAWERSLRELGQHLQESGAISAPEPQKEVVVARDWI